MISPLLQVHTCIASYTVSVVMYTSFLAMLLPHLDSGAPTLASVQFCVSLSEALSSLPTKSPAGLVSALKSPGCGHGVSPYYFTVKTTLTMSLSGC